jgi:hypothetical protein
VILFCLCLGCELRIALSVAGIFRAMTSELGDVPCSLEAPRNDTVPSEVVDEVIAEGILANVQVSHVDGFVAHALSSPGAFRALRRLPCSMETPKQAALGAASDSAGHATALAQREDGTIFPAPSDTLLSKATRNGQCRHLFAGTTAWHLVPYALASGYVRSIARRRTRCQRRGRF